MNKLKSFLFVAAIMVAVGANAQFAIGLKAGLNLSTVTGEGISEGISVDSKIGYKIGPTAEIGLGPTMAIQAGALLSLKGSKDSDANYLEVPVCFAIKFPIAIDTKIYVNAGPYFGYGLFGKTKTIFGETFDTFDRIEKIDYGATIGAGMEVLKFNFGLNYDLGLANINKSSLNTTKNGNFWISIGCKF